MSSSGEVEFGSSVSESNVGDIKLKGLNDTNLSGKFEFFDSSLGMLLKEDGLGVVFLAKISFLGTADFIVFLLLREAFEVVDLPLESVALEVDALETSS